MKDTLTWQYGETESVFFERIEKLGGWPANAKSVVYRHTGERERPCYFSTLDNVRDDWNTSIYTSDDYYLWKLSDKAKDRLREQGRQEIRCVLRKLGVG